MSSLVAAEDASQPPLPVSDAQSLSESVRVRLSQLLASGTPFPLYKDLIQLVVQNLTAPELHTAVQLSRQWYEVLKHMKPLDLEMTFFPFRPFFDFSTQIDIPPHSTVARHIGLVNNLDLISQANVNILGDIGSRLPNLSSMKVVGNTEEWNIEPDHPIRAMEVLLPQQLHTLEVTFYINDDFDHTRAFTTIASLPLLQNLCLLLNCDEEFPDFSPFIDRLPLLTTLRVNFTFSPAEDEQHVTEPLPSSLVKLLRQSSLTRLYFCCDTMSDPQSAPVLSSSITLTRMLERLNLDAIPYPLTEALNSIQTRDLKLDLPLMKSLLTFPALNKIEICELELEPAKVSLFAQLSQLSHLTFDSRPFNPATIDPSLIAIACKHCPQLKKLELINQRSITTAVLNECLAPLTQLTHLTLAGCRSIEGLTFLKQHGLPQRLQHLSISQFNLTPSVVTECIFPLQDLRSLEIKFFQTDASPELMAKLNHLSSGCAFPFLRKSTIFHLNR